MHFQSEFESHLFCKRGWSGGAMVLGKLPVPGRPTNLSRVGQGPTALAVGSGGGCLDIFSLVYHFSFLSPSLWETARYRLKYCLKGPLSPKTTNQPTMFCKNKHSTKLIFLPALSLHHGAESLLSLLFCCFYSFGLRIPFTPPPPRKKVKFSSMNKSFSRRRGNILFLKI